MKKRSRLIMMIMRTLMSRRGDLKTTKITWNPEPETKRRREGWNETSTTNSTTYTGH